MSSFCLCGPSVPSADDRSLRPSNRDHTTSAPRIGQGHGRGQKIFVGNLSFDTTSADLESLFSEVGHCESASVITDRATGRSRGFGFVEMNSAAEAGKAVA